MLVKIICFGGFLYVFLEMVRNESESEIFKVFLRDIVVMTSSERMKFDVIGRQLHRSERLV